jgi:TonB family protein
VFFQDEEHPSLLWPVGVSVLLHIVLLLLLIKVPAYMPEKEQPVLIEAWPTTPAEVEEKLAQQEDKARIADIAEPEVQERPKSAKFVGMYDSTVPKETVGTGTVGPEGTKTKGTPKAKAEKKQAKVEPKVEKKSKSKSKTKDKLYNFDDEMFAMNEPSPPADKPITPAMPAQTPKGSISIGDSSSGDYFPDIKRGNHTYLNVLRYPGVSYFVRMKRAFRTTFDPVPALRSYFSSNQVARGSVDVVLAVSVNEQGNLAELFVLRSSGIPSYDHEAMRTVRASSPFARPPEKFLADDGALRMMWTFSVYL